MKHLVLALAALGFTTGSADAACLPYGKPVTLTGHVVSHMAYGPPYFGERPEQDTKEPFHALVPDHPVCMRQGRDEYDTPDADAKEITVGSPDDERTDPVIKRVADTPMRIAVTGTFSHTTTMHHHTKILMGVQSAEIAGPTIHAAAQTAESFIREVLSRDFSTVLTVKEKEGDDRRFLAPDLYALFMKNAREFDADPYTGSQEPGYFQPERFSTEQISPSSALVTVTMKHADAESVSHISYILRAHRGSWRIFDIIYNDGRSMRSILKSLAETAR